MLLEHYKLPCDFTAFGKNKRHIRAASSNKLLNQTQLIILQMGVVKRLNQQSKTPEMFK